MLTFEDCLEMCNLTEAEIEALSEHDHEPEIVAIAHNEARNFKEICQCMEENILHARQMGDDDHAQNLEKILRSFINKHRQHQAS